MTADQYVEDVLKRRAVNIISKDKTVVNDVVPAIRKWANSRFESLEYSGSFAKKTANNISTDIDLFISLKANTKETLKEIYDSLFTMADNQGWSPVKQNVSIRVHVSDKKVDLVPGKIQQGFKNVHSLYKRKTNSWIQTNVKLHIDTVVDSKRTKEIRAIKIWRDLHNLSFPSFYLELSVIEGLKSQLTTNLGNNVLHALNYLGYNLPTKRVVDPANTNNIISDDLTATEKITVARQAKISAAKPYWKDIIW